MKYRTKHVEGTGWFSQVNDGGLFGQWLTISEECDTFAGGWIDRPLFSEKKALERIAKYKKVVAYQTIYKDVE